MCKYILSLIFFVFFLFRMCIYKNLNGDEEYWDEMLHLEPCPRFAYQLVYDQKNKVLLFLFYLSIKID